MKKATHILLLILLFPFLNHLSAQNPDDSRRIALSFYNERTTIHQIYGKEAISIENEVPVEVSGQRVGTAFNFRPDGFVVVSASGNTYPVLGYSMKGKYGNGTPPDALLAWFRYYGRQMDAVAGDAAPAPEIREARERYLAGSRVLPAGRAVEPMLRTTWDQGNYYNGMCPPDPAGPGGRCYAGCVATAVGQLMYYHRWPEQGTGEYSYTHPDYGVQYANFGEATYNWNGMETSLNGPNRHIAQLLYHLGISFDMDYGPNGSGMWNHSAANSMRNFFKYGPETQYIFRDTTTMNWDSILVANLDARKPLYYAGWEAVGSDNGHAFVCDGYAPDNFYHFNWGWSSNYDGYFLLTALTPGGSNFNFAQEVIKDIYPDTTQYNYPAYCQGNVTLNTISGTFTDGSNMVNYPGNQECIWLIRPDEPDYDSISGLQLSFPYLSLADGDQISVYAGDDLSVAPIAEVSGTQTPGIIQIPASAATVVFDAPNGNADGFLAAYNSMLPVYCSGTTTSNETAGIFNDGSGSKNYVNNSLCKWRIIPQNPVPLTITFDEFSTEYGKDFLKIYDLGNQNLIASLSGDTIPEPINLSSGKFYLVFSTDGTGTAPGWTIRWNPQGTVNTGILADGKISLYPNPAGETLTIRPQAGNDLNGKAEIYSISGQKLIRQSIIKNGDNEGVIITTGLKPGIYLLKLESGAGNQWLRFIKG